MIAPRQYAMALVGPHGRLLGFVGSRPEWSALGIEQARKFGSVAEAWLTLAESVSRYANRGISPVTFKVLGLVVRGGDS